MDFAKIKKQYRNRWVLFEFSKLDRQLKPKSGRVIAHATNKEAIYKALLRTKGKNICIEYCGTVSKDMPVMFTGQAREVRVFN
jgi:DNA polymerase III delta prime subunit